MKEIEIEEIKRLAGLSALEFDDEELEKFKGEFTSILNFIEEISKANVDGIELEYPTHDFDDLRDDEVVEGLSQEEVLANSPSTKKGSFCVPKMMEE